MDDSSYIGQLGLVPWPQCYGFIPSLWLIPTGHQLQPRSKSTGLEPGVLWVGTRLGLGMRLVHHISRFKLHSALNSHVIKWHTVIIVVDFNRAEMAEVSSYLWCMRCLQSWVANGLRMTSWRALGRSECSKAWLVSRYAISDLSILRLICVYTNIHVNIL